MWINPASIAAQKDHSQIALMTPHLKDAEHFKTEPLLLFVNVFNPSSANEKNIQKRNKTILESILKSEQFKTLDESQKDEIVKKYKIADDQLKNKIAELLKSAKSTIPTKFIVAGELTIEKSDGEILKLIISDRRDVRLKEIVGGAIEYFHANNSIFELIINSVKPIEEK